LALHTYATQCGFEVCKEYEVPPPIVAHIRRCAGYTGVPAGMATYEASTARDRHMALVRAFVRVTAYGPTVRKIVVEASREAARTHDDLADIINVALEELVQQRYKLPAFGTLLRIARAALARAKLNLLPFLTFSDLSSIIGRSFCLLLVRNRDADRGDRPFGTS
jgi:hypothetical protein